MLLYTDCISVESCSSTALQWLVSWVCSAQLQLDADAPRAAKMHWVAMVAACLAATSSFLMALFSTMKALQEATSVTALGNDRRSINAKINDPCHCHPLPSLPLSSPKPSSRLSPQVHSCSTKSLLGLPIVRVSGYFRYCLRHFGSGIYQGLGSI